MGQLDPPQYNTWPVESIINNNIIYEIDARTGWWRVLYYFIINSNNDNVTS